MRYFVYCRKSQESEDRQIMSIESQMTEVDRVFGADDRVEIVDIFEESKSAKTPGRPVFNDMITRIEAGEADGILAWHPDRLSRNSIDAGKVIYLLDLRVVKDLKFVAYTFHNTPEGKLMLSTILSFSKYYSDSLSKNVKRGIQAKLDEGWYPHCPPIGYKNCKETNTIVIDPDRFELVKRMWELMGTGCYTPQMLNRKAWDEWHLKTLERKRSGGERLTLSALYKIFKNPFYTGSFLWNGILYKGKHPPMISVEHFQRVQTLIRSRKHKPHEHGGRPSATYAGMMHCGVCGCTITSERKTNRFGSEYEYYHCTHKKPNTPCKQPSVEVKGLEEQLARFLASVSIDTKTHAFLTKLAERQRHEETRVNSEALRAIEMEKQKIAAQIETLTKMRVNNLISDEEMRSMRNSLKFESQTIAERHEELVNQQHWIEPFTNFMELRNKALIWFKNGDRETKRLILNTIGSNPTLKDKIVNIKAAIPFYTVNKHHGIESRCGLVQDFRKLYEYGDHQSMFNDIEKICRLGREQEKEKSD